MVCLTRESRLRLRRLRQNQDPPWSQYHTAQRLGIGLNRYWRIEGGYVLPKREECEALAKLFGEDPKAIFPEICNA